MAEPKHSAVRTATDLPSPAAGDVGIPKRGATPVAVPWAWVDALWFVVIVGVALALRVVYVLQLQASPWFEHHAMDPLYHHQLAEAFAKGERLFDGPFFRAPLYPWFLGTLYWLQGHSQSLMPRLVQAALGAVNCGLLFLIGRRVFGRAAGVIAGLLAAVYWTFIYFDAELLSPVIIVTLTLLSVAALLWAARRGKPVPWLAAGVLLGLGALARTDVLLLVPFVAVWMVTLHWPRVSRMIVPLVTFAAGATLVILPVTIRNAIVGHDLVLIGTYGGVNLYIGNNPGADGMAAVIPGDPAEWWPCYQAQVARAEGGAGRKLKASEVSDWYVAATWRYFREFPGQAWGRLLRKAGYFWSYWEIPNNQDDYFITQTYTPVMRYLPVGFWLVGPLGLLGVVLSFRRARVLFPLWSVVVVYCLVGVLFFVNGRFRVPAAMLLVLFAASAVVWLVQTLRERHWRAAIAAVLVLAASVALVERRPPGIDVQQVQGHRYAGYAYALQGDYINAERMLTEALRREPQAGWPPAAEAWYTLGLARLAQGKQPGAYDALARAVELDPRHRGARQNLAALLVNQGRFAQAIPHYEWLVREHPADPLVLGPYGAALLLTGRTAEGSERLLRAVELDPQQARPLLEAASMLAGQREFAPSLALLRGGLERAPHDITLRASLATLLGSVPDPGLRDVEEARRLAEEALAAARQQGPAELVPQIEQLIRQLAALPTSAPASPASGPTTSATSAP